MARGGRSAPSRSSAPTRTAPPPPRANPPPPQQQPPPPAVHHQAPPPMMQTQQPQGGGMLAGLGATMMQGMAFGTGSAIAHRAVGAVAGALTGGGDNSDSSQKQSQQQQQPVVTPSSGPCMFDMQAFNRCMTENNNNVSSCDFYYQALQQCQATNK